MRKSILIALFIPILFLLGSCEREQGLSEKPFDGRISIMPSRIATRAGFSEAGVHHRFSLEDTGGGSIQMEEKLTRLDAPATRGAVVTTETVATAYPQMTVAAYTGETLIEEIKTFEYDGEGHWNGHYENNLWDNGAVDFFMLMGDGMTSPGKSGANFSFSYTSPSSAAEQQDILFSSRRQLTQDGYESEYNASVNNGLRGGATATFCHALTGIEFAMDNESETTYITSITVKGLYGTGTCSYAAGEETPSWTTSGERTSFSEASNPTGETFWFIPQAVTSNLLLDITYTCDGITETRTNLRFGEALLNGAPDLVWGAGEIRTYTLVLKPYDVIIVFDHSENLEYTATTYGNNTNWTVFHNLTGSWYYLYNGIFREISVEGTTSNGSDKWIEFEVENETYYIQSDGSASTTRYTKKKDMYFSGVVLHTKNSKIASVKAQVNAIIDAFAADRAANRISIATFSNGGARLASFTSLTPENVTTLHTLVSEVTPSGTSMANWYGGLRAAETLDFDRESKRLVFFITGSNPSRTNDSKTNGYHEDVVRDARSSVASLEAIDATVYAIWFGETPDAATADALNDIDSSGSYKTGPFTITL